MEENWGTVVTFKGCVEFCVDLTCPGGNAFTESSFSLSAFDAVWLPSLCEGDGFALSASSSFFLGGFSVTLSVTLLTFDTELLALLLGVGDGLINSAISPASSRSSFSMSSVTLALKLWLSFFCFSSERSDSVVSSCEVFSAKKEQKPFFTLVSVRLITKGHYRWICSGHFLKKKWYD